MVISRRSIFDRKALRELTYKTPYFLLDGEIIKSNLTAYRQALPPQTEICYAMKANSEEPVLRILNVQGCSFEVASIYELALLQNLGVKPERILYGTSVKPEDTIADFFDYGVQRYAFDSEPELMKIARQAPGAKVYLRVLVDDKASSVFTMSEKFGIGLEDAAALLVRAQSLGLVPYGISFNVGSQALNVDAWANGLAGITEVLTELDYSNIRLETVNLGGGFPFAYPTEGATVPGIANIGEAVRQAAAKLPYPVTFLAEPGRGLVADAFVLVAGVFAKKSRSTGHWLYLDAGAYNALLEAMAYQGSIRYRVELLRDSGAAPEAYILTGPTGDSLDVIGNDILLPADVTIGDRLVIRDTGAYSFPLITTFNGFPAPPLYEG